MKKDVLKQLLEEKIVAIVRGVAPQKLEKLFEALYDGGIRFVELTFDQSGNVPNEETASQIAFLSEKFNGKIHIGAGTVLDVRQAELAYKAGAKYIISPSVDADVIKYCNEHEMISMPGAMTPTEIVTASRAGADLVKLFPSDSLGLSYIKAVTAPLSNVKLVAVGGINTENISDFLKVVKGVGIGSNIVKKDLIAKDDWAGITALAKKYTDAVKALKAEAK